MKQNAERREETVQNVALLKGMMEPFVKDLKEFITTTARGTENVINEKIIYLTAKIEATQHYVVKMDNRLTDEIKSVRTDMSQMLTDEIKNVRTDMSQMDKRLTNEISKINTNMSQMDKRLTNEISKINTNMSQMENRLADKIDGINKKVDDRNTSGTPNPFRIV